MFIFNGKFSWPQSALNETITVIFPAGFALNDPVSAYWQWSSDALTKKKASVSNSGAVQSVTTTVDGYSRVHFSFGAYTFDATLITDYKVLTLSISSQGGTTSGTFNLSAMHINPAAVRSVIVYTGTLEWLPNAKSEMATLVVPYGVFEGAFFGLYYQWTVDAQGFEKTNSPINGVFQSVKYGEKGAITASFQDKLYLCNFKFDGNEVSWVLSNVKDEKSKVNELVVTYKV